MFSFSKLFLTVPAMLLLGAFSVSITGAQELSQRLVSKVRRASVEILIKGQLRGGGALVANPAGKVYVLTAAHLFHRPGDTCVVVTEDERSHLASLSAYDLGHDLALIEVDPSLKVYGVLEVASVSPGETVPIFNFSPALSRQTLVIPGSVAHAGVSYTDFSSSQDYLAHYFVSGINPIFSSGGPWINRDGEIVGVQHGRLKGDEGSPSSGLSMVSPPSAVSALIKDNRVSNTPGIGGFLWEIRTAERSYLETLPPGVEGIWVNPVFKDRPLDLAGVKPFDIILNCNSTPVRRIHQFLSLIRKEDAGTTFQLEVMTPGEKTVRRVELTTDSLEAIWR